MSEISELNDINEQDEQRENLKKEADDRRKKDRCSFCGLKKGHTIHCVYHSINKGTG